MRQECNTNSAEGFIITASESLSTGTRLPICLLDAIARKLVSPMSFQPNRREHKSPRRSTDAACIIGAPPDLTEIRGEGQESRIVLEGS